jgi:hypothetical protein
MISTQVDGSDEDKQLEFGCLAQLCLATLTANACPARVTARLGYALMMKQSMMCYFVAQVFRPAVLLGCEKRRSENTFQYKTEYLTIM